MFIWYRYCKRYSQKTKRLGKGITQTESHISTETASRLYSKDMYISPSRVEKYYSCPFSYFCSYGLGVSPRRRAELNSQIRGTVTHHVLECIIKKYRDSFDELTEEVAAKEIKGFIKDYFDKAPTYTSASGEERIIRKEYLPSGSIHDLRADYACELYKIYKDRGDVATGKLYHCRKDMAGISFDKGILAKVSEDLGHHRLDVVISYLHKMK